MDKRGILIVKEPVRSVRAASIIHWDGTSSKDSSTADFSAMADPIAMTAPKYRRSAREDSGL